MERYGTVFYLTAVSTLGASAQRVPQAQVEVVKDLSTQQVHWAVQAVPRAPPSSVPQAGGGGAMNAYEWRLFSGFCPCMSHGYRWIWMDMVSGSNKVINLPQIWMLKD